MSDNTATRTAPSHSGEHNPMRTHSLAGNTNRSVSGQMLSDLFSENGTVVGVRLPTARETGRPRGFGFGEMVNSADAQNAIRRFDGYRVDNREIRVTIAED